MLGTDGFAARFVLPLPRISQVIIYTSRKAYEIRELICIYKGP